MKIISEGASADSGDQRLVLSLMFTPMAGYALETDDAFLLTQVGCLETLARYDAEAGELEPMLATQWGWRRRPGRCRGPLHPRRRQQGRSGADR